MPLCRFLRRLFVPAVFLTLGLSMTQRAAARDVSAETREIFTNEDLVKMLRAEFSDDLIKLQMEQCECALSATTDDLLVLKEEGASDEILRLVITKSKTAEKALYTKVSVQVQRLRSPDEEQYKDARRLLAAMRPERKVALVLTHKFVNDVSDVVRARVCEVLGLLGDSVALPELMQRLNDRAPGVRLQAAQAISRLATDDTYQDLVAALRDPAALHRDGAAIALGHLRDKRAVPMLLDVLNNHSETAENRGAAAFALGLIGERSPEVYEALMKTVTQDALPEVRGNCARALGKLTAGSKPRVLKTVMAALAKAYDRYPANRIDVLEAIRVFQDGRAIKQMIQGLQDSNTEVRRTAWTLLKEATGESLQMSFDDWNAWYEIKGRVRFPVVKVTEQEGDSPDIMPIEAMPDLRSEAERSSDKPDGR